MKEIMSVVLLLAEHNIQIHQVIMSMLIAGVETTAEKIFGTGGKRHKFWHKHKKRVVMVLSFQKNRASIDPIFRVKKRTRLKLKREFTNSNCVLPVVYVKLLCRFIIRIKNQILTRSKFRKKHSKRKREKKFVEYKQQLWKTLFVVEVAAFCYGIQVKWGKLTGNNIISLCLMKDFRDRFVSENTKMKDMAYLETEFVKELIQVAYFEREWSFSLGKGTAIAAETVSTKHIYGKTIKKVSLATVSREKEARLTWGVFLDVYVITLAGISCLAWDECFIDRQLGKQLREDQWRCKVKDREEKGFV